MTRGLRRRTFRGAVWLAAAAAAGAWLAPAHAQSASLLERQANPPSIPYIPPRTLQEVSLVRVPDAIPFKAHDIITIVVDERIQQRNVAQANRRKQARYALTFDDWVVILSGLRLRADEAIRAERPGLNLQELSNLQSQFQFTRNDRVQYSIAAQVMEVKPNGTLVLEAHGEVSVNNEQNTYRLTGIIDPRDVDMKTRSIKSDRIASKRVDLEQVGPTRDGYRRGWLQRVMDMFLVF
jgi:flagellar L-ring protein precursor FlgH